MHVPHTHWQPGAKYWGRPVRKTQTETGNRSTRIYDSSVPAISPRRAAVPSCAPAPPAAPRTPSPAAVTNPQQLAHPAPRTPSRPSARTRAAVPRCPPRSRARPAPPARPGPQPPRHRPRRRHRRTLADRHSGRPAVLSDFRALQRLPADCPIVALGGFTRVSRRHGRSAGTCRLDEPGRRARGAPRAAGAAQTPA